MNHKDDLLNNLVSNIVRRQEHFEISEVATKVYINKIAQYYGSFTPFPHTKVISKPRNARHMQYKLFVLVCVYFHFVRLHMCRSNYFVKN